MTPDNVANIIIALIGGLFGGGLMFLYNLYRSNQKEKIELITEQDKHEIDSGKLALEFIQELRARIDQQNNRITCLEGELEKVRLAGVAKDKRVTELEIKTTTQETEIMELRKEIADKDEIIARLNARLEAVEKIRRGKPASIS